MDSVAKWSKEWKLQLNSAKSEVALFTLDSSQAKCKPHITIHGSPINHNPTPKFLGVTLNRSLSFGPHVTNTIQKATFKLRILGAVGNTSWGWKKHDLKRVYQSHILSVIHYAGGGWQPWLSNTNILKLETAQNRALRLITGQGMSSPVEALRAEAGIPSITTQIRRNCVHIREKALRLPANHPRHTAFTAPAPRRLPKRKDARSTAEAATSRIPDLRHERIQLGYFEVPPWNAGLGKVEIFAQLEGISGKTDDKCLIKSRAIDRAKYLAADYNIYILMAPPPRVSRKAEPV